ncbi:hypothetical protein [Rothia sp. ZJ1223]|uniref:hypothetical protein n=1 Tax=Rothia sp. ZJ1223 TaxID=2811098 RepID=UPI00195B753E|nr:hypothetical protein [Rothia sp. ZJ1223]MBM7051362.1 hypothetical protein [Rothia sp. ZJ1223]
MKLRAELFEGEYVIAGTRAHTCTLLPALASLLVAVVSASFASTVYPSAKILGLLVFAGALWALIKSVRAVLEWASHQHFLTNYRVIEMRGSQLLSVGLPEIHGATVSSGWRAKICGNLTLHTRSGEYLIQGIGYPQKFSTLVRRAQHELGGL